ncbi:EthD family reductase [Amycolatopsis jejuensis]|uniref:EthD family reductase n=1 Tax=Amycolatopsis jejuensis TaxID=330084 RepID=UPI00068B82AE|nr:EthD family reductase [Amycolatopsis jejuensis]
MLKKRLILIRKRPDLDFRAFDDHWAGPHANIVVDLPGLKEYVQNPVVAPEGERDVDGFAELWDDDAADPDSARRVAGLLADDEPRFLGALTGFSADNVESYEAEAKVWVLGAFDPQVFVDAVADLPVTGFVGTEPANGRLMDRPRLAREAAAPARILTICTTLSAGPAVHAAVTEAGGSVRAFLTHTRRIR